MVSLPFSLPTPLFWVKLGKGAFSPGREKGGRRGEQRGNDGISFCIPYGALLQKGLIIILSVHIYMHMCVYKSNLVKRQKKVYQGGVVGGKNKILAGI